MNGFVNVTTLRQMMDFILVIETGKKLIQLRNNGKQVGMYVINVKELLTGKMGSI